MSGSPRPWHVIQDSSTTCGIVDASNEYCVVIPDFIAQENAALIVQAVNAHDEIVEALKQARDVLHDNGYGDLVAVIDAALAKAGVK